MIFVNRSRLAMCLEMLFSPEYTFVVVAVVVNVIGVRLFFKYVIMDY